MCERLSPDEIFDVLGHRYRRYVVAELLERDDGTTVTELVETVSRRTDADSNRIEIGLLHSHLPRLENAHVVEYDADAGVVEPTTAVSDFEPFLEIIEE
ncbi:DUF7344 domain-containing protein [Haladaptatus salinisoli]|uniref:DUF7344 domain-containing protein n=1 Tax=Haladaptatus salinisoli TaxID=2884876 RepID=UPI001D09C303|nr:ArsR family transcriptional regulator [Haladaptatus salinisoli]